MKNKKETPWYRFTMVMSIGLVLFAIIGIVSSAKFLIPIVFNDEQPIQLSEREQCEQKEKVYIEDWRLNDFRCITKEEHQKETAEEKAEQERKSVILVESCEALDGKPLRVGNECTPPLGKKFTWEYDDNWDSFWVETKESKQCSLYALYNKVNLPVKCYEYFGI